MWKEKKNTLDVFEMLLCFFKGGNESFIEGFERWTTKRASWWLAWDGDPVFEMKNHRPNEVAVALFDETLKNRFFGFDLFAQNGELFCSIEQEQ